MIRSRVRVLVTGWVVLLAIAACDTHSIISPVQENPPGTELASADGEAAAPTFLRFSSESVLKDSVATFWAVKGENREVILRFADDDDEHGGGSGYKSDDGDHFLRFKVPGESLHRRPDGSLFQEGDSIAITVRVDPDGRFIFHFEPVGLVFNPDKPAELQIWYDEADPDLDGNGVVDDDDVATEQVLRIFRQQESSSVWEDIGFVEFDPEDDEIEGEIHHFTGFALAS